MISPGRASSPGGRVLVALTVVACAAVVAALALSGSGLLVPAQEAASWTRAAGVALAVGCAASLIWREGPKTAAARIVTVAGAGALIGMLSFPASPVALTVNDDSFTGDIDEGVVGDAGADGVGPSGGGVEVPSATSTIFRLPAGASLDSVGGKVTLTTDAGTTVVLGDPTAVIGADVGAGTIVIIDDQGTLRRSDGGALGPDVALGGVTFESDGGGQVVVADGVLLPVPGTFDPETGDEEPVDRTDGLLAVLLGAFALLAFAPPIVRVGERIGVAFVDPEPEVGPDGEVERSAVSVEAELAAVLRDMLADPDPRTAVIGAYARLLVAFDQAGHGRRMQEGPHEHLWRVLGPLGVRRGPVHQLAELFVRARFTPKPVTEAHRQRAIGALADTVADLRLRADDVAEVAATLAVRAATPDTDTDTGASAARDTDDDLVPDAGRRLAVSAVSPVAAASGSEVGEPAP